MRQGELSNLLFISTSYISFFAGAQTANYFTRNGHASKFAVDFSSSISIKHIYILRRIFVVVQFVLISLLLVRIGTQGLPILAEDPEQAKVAINTAGFGLITRLMEAASVLSIAISFFLRLQRLISNQRMFLMLAPVLVTSLSSGAKGAMFAFLVGYASVHAFLLNKDFRYQTDLRRSKSTIFLFLLILFGYAFLVLMRRGASEVSAFQFSINTFGVRLLAYGDSSFYYFFNDLASRITVNSTDYFRDYFLAPIFGFLRIADYPMTLGVRIANEMFGMESGGPNPTFFVEGHVYFGLMLGFIYSFLIGFLFQGLRRSYVIMKYQFNAWTFLWIAAFYSMALSVPADMILFVGYLLNFFLLTPLVWLIYKVSNSVFSAKG
jgi:oligosaccharide repeat unit polymerase